ncbi:hypothetical protein [Candidatus Mycoplasma haematohominis]|uniref:hypothetical protein n=1 Tax=Candidatus Mycoplasma haematohominis TaxID=1494318 RepID=UPI001C0A6886|nr:hypothetical protein [Candidatus Mycoplasma haemohominis]
MFSLESIKENLGAGLGEREVGFIVDTFKRTALYFFLFGFFVSGLASLLLVAFGEAAILFILCVGIVGFLSNFVLWWKYWKYQKDPVSVSDSFISTSYFVLFLSYTSACVFSAMYLSSIIAKHVGGLALANFYMMLMVMAVFGLAFLVYMIPVSIGMRMSKRSSIISVGKLLWRCFFAWLGLFVFAAAAIAIALLLSSALLLVWTILASFLVAFLLTWFFWGAMVVRSIFRMKATVQYIDYENSYEVERWHKFFVFENLWGLLWLVCRLLSIVVRIFAGASRA